MNEPSRLTITSKPFNHQQWSQDGGDRRWPLEVIERRGEGDEGVANRGSDGRGQGNDDRSGMSGHSHPLSPPLVAGRGLRPLAGSVPEVNGMERPSKERPNQTVR